MRRGRVEGGREEGGGGVRRGRGSEEREGEEKGVRGRRREEEKGESEGKEGKRGYDLQYNTEYITTVDCSKLQATPL